MADCIPFGGLLAASRDRSAVIAFRGGTPVSLERLEKEVLGWYGAFSQASGRRFVLHSGDAVEFAAALLGAWYARKCVLVPSDLQLGSIAHSGISIDGFAGTAGGIEPVGQFEAQLPALDTEAILLEMLTSGSTGLPAVVPKCLRQLEREVSALAATLHLGPLAQRVVGTVSHQHMYGLVFRVLLPLATGRPFEAVRLTQLHDLPGDEGPEGRVLVSSPAQLARLPESASFAGRIGTILSAGGPLQDACVKRCSHVFGTGVTEIYGSSETGAVAWRSRTPGYAPAWRPLPGVEFRSDTGVLEIRTRQLPADEWFRSADRVVQLEDGFELAGRVDRIVKLDERRVSLDRVERLLVATALLQEARALVLEDSRRILAVVARPTPAGWALMEEGKRRLVEELRGALQRAAEIEVLPRRWRFVDPWPVTADGKSPEYLLRECFDRRNPEYRLLERAGTECIADIWVSPTAPFFQGHFPEHPVLAGVVQVEWLVWLSRRLMGVEAGFAGLEAAKFRRVILPGRWIRAELRHDPADSRTSYRISSAEVPCASGRIRWSADT